MLRYEAPCLPDGRYISPNTGIFTNDTTAELHRHGLPTKSDGTLYATHLLADRVRLRASLHSATILQIHRFGVVGSGDCAVNNIFIVQGCKSPKDAWDNLIAFDATNTRARKIQLKNELNTIKKGDLSANDYTLKIKALCESLSSIGVAVDDDDKVEECLRGLGNAYKQFKTSIPTRENIPHFLELSSLLVVEEKSLIDEGAIQTGRNSSKQDLWSCSRRGRGRYAQRGGVALKVKANNNSKTSKTSKISMVNKDLCVVEDSSNAGGVLVEVVVIKETIEKMITGRHARDVVEQVTLSVTVIGTREIIMDSKTH
ncbi:hypothetical protein L7F22_060559 [Adiantum nelumboides]|nr:hypothetical protein [Adiantum nelumboides]